MGPPMGRSPGRLDVGDARLGEDVLVVILVAQFAGGVFVADHDAIIVILQRGAGAHGGDGAFHEARDGILLALAEGEEDDPLGVHDGANAHGDGLGGHLFDASVEEQAGVVVDGLLGEHLGVRAAGEGAPGLIEGDVAIGADAEELDVDAAGGLNGVFVGLAGLGDILGEPVGHVGLGLVDVDMVEELGLHEVVVALVVLRGEAEILIEVEALAVLEGDGSGFAGFGEELVHLHRRGARGEAEDGLGVLPHLIDEDAGGELASLFGILDDCDFHVSILSDDGMEIRNGLRPLHNVGQRRAFLHGDLRCT